MKSFEILNLINDLDENIKEISVLEETTGERATGSPNKVYQWIIDMDNTFKDYKFELV